MTKAGVKQEDILYVGDSNVDMQTAHHAGVTAIGVAWGSGRAQNWKPYIRHIS